MAIEENTNLPLRNEEANEIESATELGLVTSMQNPFSLSKEVVSTLLEYNLCIRAVSRNGKEKGLGLFE